MPSGDSPYPSSRTVSSPGSLPVRLNSPPIHRIGVAGAGFRGAAGCPQPGFTSEENPCTALSSVDSPAAA